MDCFLNVLSVHLYLKVHEYENARATALKVLSRWTDISDFAKLRLTLQLVKSLIGCTTDEATSAASQIVEKLTSTAGKTSQEETDLTLLRVYMCGASGDWATAWKEVFTLENQKDTGSYWKTVGWLQWKEGRLEEAKTCVLAALRISERDSWSHYLLGRVLFDLGRRDASVLKEFLLAAKLDPYHMDSFLFLGHCYRHMGEQYSDPEKLDKAVRCYQRVWSKSRSPEGALALSDAYRLCQLKRVHVEHLKAVVDGFPIQEVPWAWLRLGLEQMDSAEVDQSVSTLQTLVAAWPNARAWECLADAYLSRGSFESALKAYHRVVQLEQLSPYPSVRIVLIYLRTGQYAEALTSCRSLLQLKPDYGPARVLLGEAHLLCANRFWSEARFARALTHLRSALRELSAACELGMSTFSCCWKSIADSLLLLSALPASIVEELVLPERLNATVQHGHLDLIESATRCYFKALRIQPRLGPLWTDAALSLLLQANSSKSASACFGRAKVCLKRAIRLTADDCRPWMLLGIVYYYEKNPKLAQHCLSKALEIRPRDALTWTSLGLLYLHYDNIELSHRAFQMAQSSEPSFPNSWCGQVTAGDVSRTSTS